MVGPGCITFSRDSIEPVDNLSEIKSCRPSVSTRITWKFRAENESGINETENPKRAENALEIIRDTLEEEESLLTVHAEDSPSDPADLDIYFEIIAQEDLKDRGAGKFTKAADPFSPFVGIFTAGALLIWPQSIDTKLDMQATVFVRNMGNYSSNTYRMEESYVTHFSLVLLPAQLLQWMYPGSAEEDRLEHLTQRLLIRMSKDGLLESPNCSQTDSKT